MKRHTKFKIILLLLLVFSVVILVRIRPKRSASVPLTKVVNKGTIKSSTHSENRILFAVLVGSKSISISGIAGATFYSDLSEAMKSGQIVFEGKMYPELGFFVTGVENLHAGDGKNLVYFINGKEATVGVSSYVPSNGDKIVWRLE